MRPLSCLLQYLGREGSRWLPSLFSLIQFQLTRSPVRSFLGMLNLEDYADQGCGQHLPILCGCRRRSSERLESLPKKREAPRPVAHVAVFDTLPVLSGLRESCSSCSFTNRSGWAHAQSTPLAGTALPSPKESL